MTGGRFDLWRTPGQMSADEARDLAERLERRGRVPDERAIRAAYLDLLAVGAGQQVLDVGCGSGVVTRELGRRVGARGRVVGLDASPALLRIAADLAAAEALLGVVEFLEGDARVLPFEDRRFDVALSVTVLTHVPEGARAVPEMARVVRPGGRVGVFDLDTEGLVLAHPDPALTRRIVAAQSDHGAVDGWLSRRLPGLFVGAGLVDVDARAFTPLERAPDGYYAGVALRAAETAVRAGVISAAEREGWVAALRAEQAAGRFLAGRTHLFVWGRRPEDA